MRSKIFLRIIAILAFYFGLQYFGGDIGRKILYPIRLFVTFLHEFGHAIGAKITGGWVENVQINADGSGFTRTAGGNRSVILMGGYIGSALFGNFLFFVGSKYAKLSKYLLFVLVAAIAVTALAWYNSFFTTSVLFLYAAFLIFVALKTDWSDEVLMFLGLASIIYIIQDFNVGPTSDLNKYAEIMKVFPQDVWMYIWLVVVVVLFLINLKILFSKSTTPVKDFDLPEKDFML